MNLINLLPEKTVAEQEAEHGLLYQSHPTSAASCARLSRCSKLSRDIACGLPACAANRRKAAPRSKSLRRLRLPGGKQVLKLAPLAAWTTRDVWYACEELSIPLLPLYARGLLLDRL